MAPKLIKGLTYRFIGQDDELLYIGKEGEWSKFVLRDDQGWV